MTTTNTQTEKEGLKEQLRFLLESYINFKHQMEILRKQQNELVQQIINGIDTKKTEELILQIQNI